MRYTYRLSQQFVSPILISEFGLLPQLPTAVDIARDCAARAAVYSAG